jgi:hypothetical protein
MQEGEPKGGVWLSFQVAAEEVERSLGYSWGRAQLVCTLVLPPSIYPPLVLMLYLLHLLHHKKE